MKFIGIDLAWTYKNETGICVINESGKVEYLKAEVFSDEDIVDIIKSNMGDIVCIAIDAPIVVNNEKGSRSAEKLLMKGKINGFSISLFTASRNFLTSTYGQIRGEVLSNKIIEKFHEFKLSPKIVQNRSIITETFPSGICCGLFPDIYPVKYKLKRKNPYEVYKSEMERILERFKYIEDVEKRVSRLVEQLAINNIQITKKNHKHIEDKIDAFLSAYGMYCIYKNYAEEKVFGTLEEGFITIPLSCKNDNSNSICNNKSREEYGNEFLSNEDILELFEYLNEVSKGTKISKYQQKEKFEDFYQLVLDKAKKIGVN